jgi:hypothetical protein
MADSHLQAYVIFKFASTEERPVIHMHDCAAWGEFEDAKTEPVEVSIELLRAPHVRWNRLLQSMLAAEVSRSFERPEWGGLITLDNLLQMLVWHQRHHLAHISSLRERMGWL